MNEPRQWHKVKGGDPQAAVKYGLSLKAQCGVVWTPTLYDSSASHPEIEHCPTCFVVRPGYVYRCFSADGRLLYVGTSVAPRTRMEQHKKQSWWFDQVATVKYIVFPDRYYALAREAEAIATENPRWNVRGRDRGLWGPDDYRDAHFAMQQKGATETRLHKLRLEALRRFDVDLTESDLEQGEVSA